MRLFVGLGNPGALHAGQRHNIGFMVVDRDHARKTLGHVLDPHDRRRAHATVSAVWVGRCRRIATTVSTMVTRIRMVDAALTSGVAPNRTIE
jgi:peptidyl-tRNA hydrolase